MKDKKFPSRGGVPPNPEEEEEEEEERWALLEWKKNLMRASKPWREGSLYCITMDKDYIYA